MGAGSSEKYPESELTERVIGVAIEAHKRLGPGFKEKIYQRALEKDLLETGFKVEREKRFNVSYKGEKLGHGSVDLLIEGKVIVEVKAVDRIHPAHAKQLLSYLKSSGKRVGLILNFGDLVLRIKRVVN